MTMQILIPLLALAAAIIGGAAGLMLSRKSAAAIVTEAQRSSEALLTAARKEAETAKKAAIVEAREAVKSDEERAQQKYQRLAEEHRNRQAKLESRESDLDRQRQRLDRKEEDLDRKLKTAEEDLAKKVAETSAAKDRWQQKLADLDRREQALQARAGDLEKVLEQAAQMTVEQARQQLIERVAESARQDAVRVARQIEEQAAAEAEQKARRILATAVQRFSGEYIAEKTVTVVPLPDEQIKGRIIGREGRNIRAFEMITGVDLIVDDTPDSVVISCHNPLRRENARLTLEKLLEDGRIQPTRIEELYQQVTADTEKNIFEAGQDAVFDLGLQGLHPELVRLMGINKFRTSFAQNILLHSQEVAYICGMMAAELGLDETLARRCGFLHDIGKAVDQEFEGGHATIGGDLVKKFGEHEEVIKAVAEHHDDPPSTIYGVLVQAADTLSAARPGARRESMQLYLKRLEDLEAIAKSHQAVDKAFAIQAGRELRIIVDSERSDDAAAYQLAKAVAAQIEHEMKYPGQIKVTVVRETRAIAYAK